MLYLCSFMLNPVSDPIIYNDLEYNLRAKFNRFNEIITGTLHSLSLIASSIISKLESSLTTDLAEPFRP